MATIHIDNKQYEVDGSDNLLHACLSLGLDIPYFCWHPALGSVGACRQCAVKQYKDADDTRGRIVMSCMTPSSNGSYISIDDAEAQAFRKTIVEFLMSNHPHDCPVCEEGGHCHLQDVTVMTGHARRRYRFAKRTHKNQELGPFIAHEMNRCIACYRCVRYYNDYAGGTDLGVFGTANNVYFGRAEDGTLENEFSGNLTEVCPTGVFTDKTHSERYVRKWDMQFAPSICGGCSMGCNTSPGERYGEIRRVENRYNSDLNHYFLCDRGRFGYGYTNRKDRPHRIRISVDGATRELDTDEGLDAATRLLGGAGRVVGIGSPRASVEANFALRQRVGADNFSTGLSAREHALTGLILQLQRDLPIANATLRGVEARDAALVLGEDVMQTAPRLALSLRQLARGAGLAKAIEKKVPPWQADGVEDVRDGAMHPLFVATPADTRLDDIAADTVRATPADLAALGYAVARIIDDSAPAIDGLDDEAQGHARRIAEALLASDTPLIVSGTGCDSAAVIEAAANVALALYRRGKPVEWVLIAPEANSLGVRLMDGVDLDTALGWLAAGEADTVLVLENDLYRRAPRATVDTALSNKTLLVIDHQMHETAQRAKLLLPAATLFESDGTLVNYETRAQRYFQVFDPSYYDAGNEVRESWRWLQDLGAGDTGNSTRPPPLPPGEGRGEGERPKSADSPERAPSALIPSPSPGGRREHSVWGSLDEVTAACALAVPALAGIVGAAPGAAFRYEGMKMAREPHRYSGRTAMRANLSVHEPRAPQDPDSALAFSMEGYQGTAKPASLIAFAWAPHWNSPQAWNKFQDEVGGALRINPPSEHLIKSSGSGDYRAWSSPAPAEGPVALPLHHIFGSDALSARAAPIASRMPAAYVALHPDDASRLGLAEGESVKISLDGTATTLPLRLDDSLMPGQVGLPRGLPDVPYFDGGAAVELGADE